MKTNSKAAKSKNARASRRDFLSRTAAATAAFTIVPRYVLGARGHTAPSEKLNVAMRTKQKLAWNGKEMKATNANNAEQFIKPEFHNGWTI